MQAVHIQAFPNSGGLGMDSDSGLRTLSKTGLSLKESGFLSRLSLSKSRRNLSTFSI